MRSYPLRISALIFSGESTWISSSRERSRVGILLPMR
jgi:hypothetical protein